MPARKTGRPRRRSTAHLVLVAAVATLALLVPTVANAPGAAKAKRKVDLVVKAAAVATTGDRNTVTGTFTGPPYGSGAVVYKTRPSGGNVAATYIGYTSKGTLRGTTLVTPAPQPDGTVNFAGTLQVKGGTGRYRGATGKDLKVTGSFSPTDEVFTFQIKGTVRY